MNRRAFTLIELMVAFFIAMLVYMAFSRVFRSSGQQIEKGTRMLELQTLLDAVEHNLREDVRRLRKVELSTEETPNRFCFQMYSRDEIVRVEYEYSAAEKAILRKELSGSEPLTKRIAAGHVDNCVFAAVLEDGRFKRLDLAMSLTVDSNLDTADRTVSIAAHFTSRCNEPYKPWLAAP